jgi:integrase
MRYSELARLKVGDVHLDAATLTVAKSKAGKSRTVALSDEGLYQVPEGVTRLGLVGLERV